MSDTNTGYSNFLRNLKDIKDFKCELYLGKHNALSSVDPSQATIGIEKYFVHENYEASAASFDIALQKLNKIVQYDKNIKPICLSFDLPELTNTSTCYATGWGRDDHSKYKAQSIFF